MYFARWKRKYTLHLVNMMLGNTILGLILNPDNVHFLSSPVHTEDLLLKSPNMIFHMKYNSQVTLRYKGDNVNLKISNIKNMTPNFKLSVLVSYHCRLS